MWRTARDHSRGRETSEHSGDQRWTHEIDGLRDGAAFQPRYEGYFPAGDAGLLVPGADHGACTRCALGHIFVGSVALRNADGDFAICGGFAAEGVQSCAIVAPAAAVPGEFVNSDAAG